MMDVNHADDIIAEVSSKMNGRIALENGNVNLVAWCAAQCDGDHLEIGTLHGGSAIVVALAKSRAGRSGDVWCIDPLDGYYKGTRFAYAVDWVSKVPVSPEVFHGNLAKFDVAGHVHIIQAKSQPFPNGLPNTFATAYIDGDHWGDVPLQDWNNVKDKTTRYVIFDNCDPAHPAVMAAVDVAGNDDNWKLIYQNASVAVVERVSSNV